MLVLEEVQALVPKHNYNVYVSINSSCCITSSYRGYIHTYVIMISYTYCNNTYAYIIYSKSILKLLPMSILAPYKERIN